MAPGVQRSARILSPAAARVDSCSMRSSLRHAIDSGEYLIDPEAVADAILRRALAGARALPAFASSEVLVAPDLGGSPATEAPQSEAAAFDDPA